MKTKTLKTLILVCAILLAAAWIAEGYVLFTEQRSTLECIYSVLLMLTGALAIFYILSGCNKAQGARFFRAYMLAFAAATFVLIALIGYAFAGSVAVLQMLRVFTFGCLFLLCFAQDLGQKRSTALAVIVVVCEIAAFFFPAHGTAMALAVSRVNRLLLAATTLLMVCAKYEDKKARGSK